MQDKDELKKLVAPLKDASRNIAKVGKDYYVPLKYDSDGTPLTDATFDPAEHLKKLNLNDLRFLYEWRKADWDFAKACAVLNLDTDKAKRVQKKVQAFKDEEAYTKALAQIPTPTWVASKHTENVFTGKLDDGQRDSLKELAKITGAYKPTTNVNLNAHIFQMPSMSPDEEKKAREFFDTIAVEEFKHAV